MFPIALRTTAIAQELTKFQMPAMSPTMTEGGIASWKKKEGETFTAGDVLLEIVSETGVACSSIGEAVAE
jgi:hypothetical protein